jgi:hypothetical protein
MPDSVVVCPPPARVRIAGRSFVPGADRGVATMLTAASSFVALGAR